MNYKIADMLRKVTKLSDIIVVPADLTFDATEIGCDAGSMFGMVECIDFNPSDNGSIWFNFKFQEAWDLTKNINVDIEHNLNGTDTGKVVSVPIKLWVMDKEVTAPVEGTPTVSGTSSITSDTTNQGKYDVTTLGTAISSGSLTSNTKCIVGKLTRDASNVADTYGGTFQLSKIRFYQV